MSADPIVYCLEHLTDYRQFERLCSDIMNQSGYPNIEPLGGSADRGRDALHISRTDPEDVTIFAYSVRGDWEKKLLKEDCKRIEEEGHELNRLLFACTATINATQRDKVKQLVLDDFGWELELFDLERIRVRLVGDLRRLIAQHPAIFGPPFFPRRGGLSIAESRDTLVIDHVVSDHALATWLARRLQLAGYRTWCIGTAPLAGETADDSVRTLIENRALRYVPVLSRSSVGDSDFLGRCGLACGVDELVLPCRSESIDESVLPTKMRQLTDVDFSNSRTRGLKQILDAVQSYGIQPNLSEEQGKAIALRSYVPEPVTSTRVETVYTNTFAVTIPTAIQICELATGLTPEEEEELRKAWAFVKASATTLLTFTDPPDTVQLVEGERIPGYDWKHYKRKEGKRSDDVVKELVRRSIDVACIEAGLYWCSDRRVFYFPHLDDKPLRNASYIHVDGRKTRVGVTGQQTYGSGENAKPFRYQLCPKYSVGYDEFGGWWITFRIYVRITEVDGTPYEKKAITRRRKQVGKSWWNKEWFARTIAVVQSLAQGNKEIVIGARTQQVSVSTEPMEWECPVSIDYLAVERVGDFQEEMALLRYVDEDAELEEEDEGEDMEGANE